MADFLSHLGEVVLSREVLTPGAQDPKETSANKRSRVLNLHILDQLLEICQISYTVFIPPKMGKLNITQQAILNIGQFFSAFGKPYSEILHLLTFHPAKNNLHLENQKMQTGNAFSGC